MREAIKYWLNPPPEDQPDHYADLTHVSHYICEVLSPYLVKGDSILELGCNCGRNMHYLGLLGYECVGIELNTNAADVGRGRWNQTIMVGDITDILPTLPDDSYDCVFTQSVLMHMENPPMKEISRVARRIILTNEVEYPSKLEDLGKFRWARKYGFSGWKQVYYKHTTGVKDISVATTRIFRCETE